MTARPSVKAAPIDDRQPITLLSTGRIRSGLAMTLAMGFGVQLLGLSSPSAADSLNTLDQLTQGQFKSLAENLGAATHYKSLSPAEPLGLIGFDVAVELSATDIDEDAVFDAASSGDFDPDQLLMARLHVHKGLPFGLDIGASYGTTLDTDFTVFGAELRYAILEGSTITPALALRGTYSQVSGDDALDMQNAGLELSVSKGFLMLTPYAGVGIVRTIAEADDAANLSKETVDQTKLYAGVNVNLGFNFGVEADQTGDHTTYSVKAGLRF